MPTIRENKGTCAACGNVWFWGKSDQVEKAGSVLQTCMKSMMGCSGCYAAGCMPWGREVRDFRKCPRCGSRAVKVEVVQHDV